MMIKKMFYIVLTLSLFPVTILHAQIPEGKYVGDSNTGFILFKDGKVEFRFTNVAGGGSYSIKKNKIIIVPDSKYDKQTLSTYEFMDKKDSIKGEYIFNVSWKEYAPPFNYAKARYKIKEYPYFSSFSTDTTGVGKHVFKEMPIDSIVFLRSIFFNPVKIKLQNLEGGIFNVTLKEGSLLYADEHFSKLKKLKVAYEFKDGILHLTTLFKDIFHRGTYYTFEFRKEENEE